MGGRNPQEHDEIIKKVFQRLGIYGFHVNYAKMQYRKNEVEFLGINLRGGKVYMDSYIKKLKAKLHSITCNNDLQTALGLLNVLRPSSLDWLSGCIFLPLDQTNCEEEALAENLTRFSGNMDSGFGVFDSFGTT